MSVPKAKLHLPYGWEVHQSKTFPDRVFYYNKVTQARSWDCPKLVPSAGTSQNSKHPASRTPPFSLPTSPDCAPGKIFNLRNSEREDFVIPEALLRLPPASSKATSPPCVSSSSEVLGTMTLDVSDVNATNPKHMGKRKLLRPDMHSSDLQIDRNKSNARYQPYSVNKKPDAKSVSPTKTLKTYIPQTKINTIKLNGQTNQNDNFLRNGPAPKETAANREVKTAVRRIKRFPVSCVQSQNNVIVLKPTSAVTRTACPVSARATTVKPVAAASGRISLKPIPKASRKPVSPPLSRNSVRPVAPPVSRNTVRPVAPPVARNTVRPVTTLSQTRNATQRVVPSAARITTKPASPAYSKPAPVTTPNHVNQKQVINHVDPEYAPDYSTDVEMLDLSNDVDATEPKGYYIVLDTNVLIGNLKFVDELKDSPLEGCGPPTIIVPWVVLQELDRLKNQRGEKAGEKPREDDCVHKAGEAVRYIYEMLQAKHPRICGQSSMEVPKPGNSSFSPSCNDDMILHCCLQMIETVPRDKVILLTNDKNLCNKAMVHNVKAYTSDTIFQHLKVDFSVTSSPAYAMSCRISLSTDHSESNESLRTEVDRIMILAKSALKKCLAVFLENEMQTAYGSALWLKIVYAKPPWSLLDILECFSKHWISVFTFVLEKRMEKNIEQMKTALKTVKGYICDEQQALSLVTSGLSLCCAIAAKGLATAGESQEQLLLLQQQLLCLGKNNEPSTSSSGTNKKISDSKRNETVCGANPSVERSSQNFDVPPDTLVDVNTRVKQVFHHVWNILNHLCGTVLDSLGWPHKLEYQRPPSLPSKEETHKFIAELYPQLHKLKKLMQDVVSSNNHQSKDSEANMNSLFRQLLTILPSLNVKEPHPVRITDDEFRLFCTSEENKDILQGGFKQLSTFFSLVHKSIVGAKKPLK